MQEDLIGMTAQSRPSVPGRSRRKGVPVPLSLKVTHSGSVALCGFGRFPVTLTKGQWMRLLAMSDDIKTFIAANEGHLAPDD
jgi:hypothetical protein